MPDAEPGDGIRCPDPVFLSDKQQESERHQQGQVDAEEA